MADTITNEPADRDLGDFASRVAPLSELDDYEIADGYPEVRGWDVRDSAGRSIGYVYDLIVDVAAMRVRYLDVELDPEFAGTEADRRVLIPIDTASVDGPGDDVLLTGIHAADVRALVPYARRGVARARESTLQSVSTSTTSVTPRLESDADFYASRHYDDVRLFTPRQSSAPATPETRVPGSQQKMDPGERSLTENRPAETDVRPERVEVEDPTRRTPGAGQSNGSEDRA